MSWCKCPGVPRGQPPGMAAGKCITSQSKTFSALLFSSSLVVKRNLLVFSVLYQPISPLLERVHFSFGQKKPFAKQITIILMGLSESFTLFSHTPDSIILLPEKA